MEVTVKSLYFYLLLVLILALGFAILVNPRKAEVESSSIIDSFRLETYEVPSNLRHQLRELMNRHFRAVSGDGPSIARIEMLPGGQVVLIGPAEVQKGFADVVAKLQSSTPDQTLNYVLDCWVVLGPQDLWTSMESRLNEADVENWLSDQGSLVEVLEHLRLIGAEGSRTQIDGTRFVARPDFAMNGKQWVGELQIQGTGRDGMGTGLETQLALFPNRPALIGGSSLSYHGQDQRILDMLAKHSQIYYLVRIQNA